MATSVSVRSLIDDFPLTLRAGLPPDIGNPTPSCLGNAGAIEHATGVRSDDVANCPGAHHDHRRPTRRRSPGWGFAHMQRSGSHSRDAKGSESAVHDRLAQQLVGREAEQAVLDRARWDHRSVLLTGDIGIGKSRLLYWTAERACDAGWRVVTLLASPALVDYPLGAFAHVSLATRAHAEPDRLLHDLLAHLHEQSGEDGRLLLLIDAATWLDAPSAALVTHLVTLGTAVVAAAARTGAGIPAALAELVGSRLLDVVPIRALDPTAIRRLAEALSRHPVSESFAAQLHGTSGGNPLFASELALEADERAGADGLEAATDTVVSFRTGEILIARLGRLSDAERAHLETLALTGATSLAMLERLGDTGALARLEERNLIVVLHSGARSEVRLTNAIVGEIVWATTGELRRRRQAAAVVRCAQDLGMRRADDARLVERCRRVWGETRASEFEPHADVVRSLALVPASPQIDEAEAAVEPAPVEYNDAGEDSRKTEPAGRYACLTGRERQIAQLIETNASDRDIAEELALSVRTVHAHVRSIFTKLGISRRAQLRATHSIDSTTAV